MIYESILHTSGARDRPREPQCARAREDVREVRVLQPVSSVKDRLAIAIIEDAEQSGALKPVRPVVDGDVGATLASRSPWCAPPRAIRSSAVMVETFSVERRKIMRMLGREGDPHAGGRAAQRHGAQRPRTREEKRLVPRAAVREPGQSRPITPDHGAEILRRLRRPPPRLLRHRLGHGGTLTGAGE